jgi:hypothetical protein
MANIFLAWQNRVDDGTLSGGSWLSALPLANVQNRQVQKVARSTNAAEASTKFDLDLLSAQSIGVFALVVHNISNVGKVRITASNDATAYDNDLPVSDLTSGWTMIGAQASLNTSAGPDGTTTADLLYEDTFGGNHFFSRNVGVVSGARFFEAWVKAAGRTRGRFQLLSVGGSASISFDLSSGSITSSTGSAVITAHANGWFKIKSSATFSSASASVDLILQNASGQEVYTGDGASGLLVFGIRTAAGDGLAADSGWIDVWPAGVIPTDLLEWEDDNFWLGTISAQARAGFQSPLIWRLPFLSVARYWRCEIFDSTNSDGYVQVGRVFLARGWTPSVNFAYGAGLGYQDPTPVLTSLSGAEYFDVRSKFRVMTFELQYITDSEAYSYALELQRLAGVSGEVLVMPDGGEDAGIQPLRSFVGRLRQAGPVMQTKPSAYTVQFEIKELL